MADDLHINFRVYLRMTLIFVDFTIGNGSYLHALYTYICTCIAPHLIRSTICWECDSTYDKLSNHLTTAMVPIACPYISRRQV